ncbi:hypothetical protein A3860_25430 [Niastella vici]|uniref:Uncharacterized protein n=1 Tax=Niastella vici TaxID=1703345 RepID=A0A1V9FY37_9BACT|nr:hypothetical protein [Niastella vici]OQP63234.1 hypothetical protein A3860_25430 [Niastella vici]
MAREIIYRIVLLGTVWAFICLQACESTAAKVKPVIKHMAEIHRKGSDLYLDEADSRQVMKAGSNNNFIAYKIGFTDSLTDDKKFEQKRIEYYDYRMVNDWKAVVNGDSISPVFFQPVTGLNKMNREGILVFELPTGSQPDALVYDDSFGNWQKQIIALNPHLK